MTDLTVRFAAASQAGHVIMAGDLNARVGNLLESASAKARDCTGTTITAHGRRLIILCRDTGSLLCTCRTLSDEHAFYSLKPADNFPGSRIDHVVVPAASLSMISGCGISTHRSESHHYLSEGAIALRISSDQQQVCTGIPIIRRHGILTSGRTMEIAYEVRLAKHCYSRLLFLQMQVM